MKIAVLCLFWNLTLSALATSWSESSPKDPISGKDTKVWEIIAYGGYIYQWPSKFDGVYWPYTVENHIRFSPDSGYIAFGEDFTEITDEEKRRVSDFLTKNYKNGAPPKTHYEKLDWLAKVYRARKASDSFWLRYHCLRAYLARADEDVSTSHRKSAIEIAARLESILEPGFERAQALFVLGSYSHMLGGKERSKEYFKKLAELKWERADPEAGSSEGIVGYFSTLAEEIASDRYKLEYLPKPKPDGEQTPEAKGQGK